ncbi:MAG TPA: PAS-domain containing protein [Mesorhizobium sp.]|jgi:PAS domain S-box-containing protein|nr:PAS-domain containing protein [Mesorhizobium sp.]
MAEAVTREQAIPAAINSDLLQDAIESIAEGFLLFDAQDRLVALNQRYRELFEIPDDEVLLGCTSLELLKRCVAKGCYKQAIGREEEFIAERLALRRDVGRSYDVQLSNGRWMRCSDRRTREGGMVSIRADVTEEKRREERLAAMEREARESEERLLEIVQANPLRMTITRVSDGSVVYANQRVAEMVRVPLNELLGRRSIEFYAKEADREIVMRQLREEGQVELLEVQFKRGDGSTFPIAVTGRPISYRGEPAIVAGLHDLSPWRRMKEALHQNEKLAALGSLLAGVAHELNNPLAVVLAQAALIQETVQDPAALRRVDKIHTAAQRCARIVRSFLAIARQRPPEYRVVDLSEIIRDALELTAYALRSNGVEVRLDLPGDLPPVWGDADQLGQVFMNLIVNAQHAMQSRQGLRRLTFSGRLDPVRHQVVLRIADTGPGVPPEIRGRIFDAFFTTKPMGMGTGVGLSVCLGIIGAHGGTLQLDEAAAEGATFVVALPALNAQARAAADPVPTATVEQASWTILIVDDEPEIRQTMAEILMPLGRRIDLAANGLEALKLIEERQYDLVVSDLRMPELDGPGLHQRLQARGNELSERMLFLTGDTLHHELDGFLKSTRAPVLEKPLAPAEVRRRVTEFMRGAVEGMKLQP